MWLWIILLAVALFGALAVFAFILTNYLELEDNTVNVKGNITITSPDVSLSTDCVVLECTRNLGRILRGKRYIDLKEDRDDMTCMELEIASINRDDAEAIRKWIFTSADLWNNKKGSAVLRIPFGVSGFDTTYLLSELYPTSIRLIPTEVNSKDGNVDSFQGILTLSATWAIPTNSKLLPKTGLRHAHA